MQNNRRPTYQFTQERKDDEFFIGPLSMLGHDFYINPHGSRRAIKTELANRQADLYRSLDMSVTYHNGKLVLRAKRTGRMSGFDIHPIPNCYTMEQLATLADRLLT
jgi:hypothetical protein